MWRGNVPNVSKRCTSSRFDRFSDPPIYLKDPYTTNKVHSTAYILSKVSTNEYYRKMDLFLVYVKWKCTKCTQKLYIYPFWPIFGPSDPLKGPLHYYQSTFYGSYSPKSLHKLVLPENGFISIFSEVKILLGSPKVDVGGKIYEIFT